MPKNKKFFMACFGVLFSFLPISALCGTSTEYCYSFGPGAVQYRPSPEKSCETQSRTCCNNGYFSIWGEDCPVEKWTYTKKTLDTLIDCSGYSSSTVSICDGSVIQGSALFTSHQLRRCEMRARGTSMSSSEYYGKGDGSTCGDTNWVSLFDPYNGGTASNVYSYSCSGYASSYYHTCTQSDRDNCTKGLLSDGQIMCVLTIYNSTCVQSTQTPCTQDGLYCNLLESSRGVTFHRTKGRASVYICQRE